MSVMTVSVVRGKIFESLGVMSVLSVTSVMSVVSASCFNETPPGPKKKSPLPLL